MYDYIGPVEIYLRVGFFLANVIPIMYTLFEIDN